MAKQYKCLVNKSVLKGERGQKRVNNNYNKKLNHSPQRCRRIAHLSFESWYFHGIWLLLVAIAISVITIGIKYDWV